MVLLGLIVRLLLLDLDLASALADDLPDGDV